MRIKTEGTKEMKGIKTEEIHENKNLGELLNSLTLC
jgi:hypothetical protein